MVISEAYPVTFNDCIYKALRRHLIFGKFLGVIPIEGLFETKNGSEHLSVRYMGPHNVVTVFVTLIQVVKLVFEAMYMVNADKSSAYMFVKSVYPVVADLNLFFGYVYLLRNPNGIIKLFRKWRSVKLHFTKCDTQLGKYVLFIQCLAFISTGAYMFLYYFRIVEFYQGEATSFLQFYYEGIFGKWAEHISYHPVLSVILVCFHVFHWCLLSYVEVLIIIITRAFYLKFKTMVHCAEQRLVTANSNDHAAQMYWTHVTKDNDALCKLLEQFAKFLSPIIFTTYVANIYSIGIKWVRILSGATIKHWPFHLCELLFVIGKTWLLTSNAVNVNESALLIRGLFKDCPNACYYSINVHRAVQRIESQPNVGFHGLGCFYITKPFFLTILSTLFTMQIILLSQP